MDHDRRHGPADYATAVREEERATALELVASGQSARLWHAATGLVVCATAEQVEAFFERTRPRRKARRA